MNATMVDIDYEVTKFSLEWMPEPRGWNLRRLWAVTKMGPTAEVGQWELSRSSLAPLDWPLGKDPEV